MGNLPMVFFGFICRKVAMYSFFFVGTVLIAAVCICFFVPGIPEVLPTILFVFIVIYGWAQAIYEYNIHSPPRNDLVIEVYVSSFSFYVVGFFFFLTKIPERFFPGKFDLIGHSHNWWHLLVTGGAIMHYFNSLRYMDNEPSCE